MITIPHPDKGLLRALEKAGVIPPDAQPACETVEPAARPAHPAARSVRPAKEPAARSVRPAARGTGPHNGAKVGAVIVLGATLAAVVLLVAPMTVFFGVLALLPVVVALK
ncbi:MAG: hypothetical protein ABFC88_13055 [Thermoguttaceae bacterium]